MTRIEDIQEALRREGLDGWLFFDHHHRDPLAYRILGLETAATATRRWYYFIPVAGEPHGLVHRIEPGMLDALPGAKIAYARWTEQTGGIRGLLAGARRIAMQYSPNCAVPYVSMVDGGTLELVRSTGVEVVSSENLVQLFEARWNKEQVRMHLEAGRRVDRIRASAFRFIAERLHDRGDLDEWIVHRFIRDEFGRNGLAADHGPIVAVNANASNPHYEPSERVAASIREGDFVLIDMWAKLDAHDAVYYDITWTGYCGSEPPGEMRRVFEIVREARDRAVARVRDAIAGGGELRGFEVDDTARGHIAAAGLGDYFVHRTGHSIGTEVHGAGANMDNYETHDERRIVPWTCFSIEPGVYLPEFGVRSEVNVLVSQGEARVTGEAQDALITIKKNSVVASP
ncbi:MAG: M24 family metallopeptidase [Acidobacteria bacterium]|nr:M24 family metallopeptidase [Acidobacteriota bacterium]MBI3281923.1 M24 family metallopeptidase [Acidobacteriota bacterium]